MIHSDHQKVYNDTFSTLSSSKACSLNRQEARHLAIGDIHGCYEALLTLVDYVGIRPTDVIVTLGDYPNRGPGTCAVIDWLIAYQDQVVAIRGNHDIMMLNARDEHPLSDPFQKFIKVGGDATLKSYSMDDGPGELSDIPDAHWDFLEELKPYHEIETHFFVHGNVYAEIPLDEQPDFMLYWEQYNDPSPHESGKTMVCGHTSQKSGLPITNGHAICIDTWAHGGGWLSCLDVGSGKIWQANQAGETRRLWLDEL